MPNEAFIAERVVNWTLADPIARVVIPVGIAYGSDTTLAHRVMLDTVCSLPLVLDESEPRVWFVGFGESSLDFKVYTFVRKLGDRLPLTHELHTAVERALRQYGIQIPFPQRDIHVHHTHEDLSYPLQPPYATGGAISALPGKGAGAAAQGMPSERQPGTSAGAGNESGLAGGRYQPRRPGRLPARSGQPRVRHGRSERLSSAHG